MTVLLKSILLITICLFTMFIFVSCEKLKEGYIYGKKYEPAHTYLMPVTMYIGKQPYLTYTTIDVEDKYKIYIKSQNGEETDCYQVDEETYNKYKIGDYFKVSE